jgi:pimeloyl-ACP methyl ester carboxylesterase
MSFVRVGGIDIHYEEHGAGSQVLVVAHGLLGSVGFSDLFGLKASVLAARGLRVIAYDARGHGRSGHFTANAAYDQKALAGELVGVLDGLGLERVSLCGTSMGATSALVVARDHPDRVDRLVLRTPAPFGTDMVPARRALHVLARSYQLVGVPLTARLGALWPGPGGARRMRALLGNQRRAAIVPAIRGFVAEPLAVEGLERIAAPALVLTQPDDRLHPLRSGEILQARLRQAELRVAATPRFWDEDPEAMADRIAGFVAPRGRGDLPRGAS